MTARQWSLAHFIFCTKALVLSPQLLIFHSEAIHFLSSALPVPSAKSRTVEVHEKARNEQRDRERRHKRQRSLDQTFTADRSHFVKTSGTSDNVDGSVEV